MKDRLDYRFYDDKQLIEEAKYNPNAELAIVLGERLEDISIDGSKGEAALERDLEYQTARADEAESITCQLEARLELAWCEVEHLKNKISELRNSL